LMIVRELLDKLKLGIQQAGGNPTPDMPPPIPVDAPGSVDLGKTFGLQVAGVSTIGDLNSLSPSLGDLFAAPPPGFEFVGPAIDLSAEDGLLVSLGVEISIEYGSTQLLGPTITNPNELALARIANGGLEFLQTDLNDPVDHVITAGYSPESASSGLDQFGEFVIVQAIPEPSSLALLTVATVGLLGRRRWRSASSVGTTSIKQQLAPLEQVGGR